MKRRTSIAALPALVGSPAFLLQSATGPVAEAEAKAVFAALLEERTAAVEKGIYSKIEPLYSHDEDLVVFRPDLVLRGWKAVEAFWQRSLSRVRSDFHVYWNDDLAVIVDGDLIVGALTWSNQAGDNPRRYGCLTLTLRRQNDRWLIVHEHSSNWTKPPSTGP
jgi:ketosteroid isomerase-like protein